MINNISGLGYFDPFRSQANVKKEQKTDFMKSLDSIITDSSEKDRYGITAEQKKLLNDKYGSCELTIGSKDTEAFMEELNQLGVITENDMRLTTSFPEWCVPDKYQELEVWVSEETDNAYLNNMDIRNSFHTYSMLQKKVAQETSYDCVKDFFTNTSNTYDKLANIMDYIFS